MIKYRITKADDKILTKMGEDNWQLISISDGKFYFSKKVVGKTDIIKRQEEETKEFKEFKEKYKKIKASGLYNKALIPKYNKLVEEGLHETIMKNLDDYMLYLEVKKKKNYALMATTYINQERYKDEWEVVEDMSRKFINDIYKEKSLNADEVSYINTEISAYEAKHHREVTDGVVRNMIQLRINK